MTEADIRARAIALYDSYTHDHRDRRAFLREMSLLAGGTAAATALLAGIAPDAAAAAIVAADDKRLKTRSVDWQSAPGRKMSAYVAQPAKGKVTGTIIVIHENRGLNDHTRDVARRAALAGYIAVAPDFLAPVGGTPADENAARDSIGKLDLALTVADGQSAISQFAAGRKVGIVGFCWGGGMVTRLAVAGAPALAAVVPYYGPAPAPAEAVKVTVPIMFQLAGLDTRVNTTAKPFAEALQAAGKTVTVHEYPGVNHAFNNDTSAERYDAAAAKLAWDRTLAFFKARLTA